MYKNVLLLDTEGNIRLKVIDGQEVIGPDAKKLAEEAIRSKNVVFSDLYRSKITDVIRLTLAVPLLVSKGSETVPIGVILLRVDPCTQQLEDINRRLEDEIIERKQIEKELKKEELRYRTLFEQSPEGIVLIDPETARHIDFNEIAHQQLGYSRDEFIQMRVSDYEAIEKPEDTKARIEKILREGGMTLRLNTGQKMVKSKISW